MNFTSRRPTNDVMGYSLSDNEQFVMESLSSSFGGSWRKGEDPPDAYLMHGNIEVAIEISALFQHVTGKYGTLEPRLSQDMGVLRICDELNREIGNLIQSDSYVILTLHAPVEKLRKFKSILKDRIMEIVTAGTFEKVSLEIYGKKIKAHLVKGQMASGKKIVGIVANHNADPNISLNADFILSHRIKEKTQKCSHVTHRPLWLALFNDYWLAEPNSYRYAMRQYSENHPFGKILLISGNREVHLLFEALSAN